MKLYNRLLSEGIFLFWEDENQCDYYTLDFYINNLDKKIKIKEIKVDGNTRCYSFDKIGNGEYYFELVAYKNGRKLKATKKVILNTLNIQIAELKSLIIELGESIDLIQLDLSNTIYNLPSSNQVDNIIEAIQDLY